MNTYELVIVELGLCVNGNDGGGGLELAAADQNANVNTMRARLRRIDRPQL